jgi:hypothetical protein
MTSQTNFGRPLPHRSSKDPSFRDLHASQIALTLWLQARNARDHGVRHHQWCYTSDSRHLRTRLIAAYKALCCNLPGIKYRTDVVRSHRIWRRCVHSNFACGADCRLSTPQTDLKVARALVACVSDSGTAMSIVTKISSDDQRTQQGEPTSA